MQFLFSVIDDRTGSATEAEMAAIDAFNDRLRAEGRWIAAVGLTAPVDAVVIDGRSEPARFVSGPFAKSTEYVAGLWLLHADDLETARALAVDASRACGRRVELRAVLG